MARITPGIAGSSLGSTLQNTVADLPVVYSQDIQGGLTSVDNAAGLLAIPAQKIQPGMIAYDVMNDRYYRFVQGSLIRSTTDSTFDSAITMANWEQIQFDVDSITVASGNVDPTPSDSNPTGDANPANPHEGDLYINHMGNSLWYYVAGNTNMWVSSAGITQATGDDRYLSYERVQTLNNTQRDQARSNIDINLTSHDTVAQLPVVYPSDSTFIFWSNNNLRFTVTNSTTNLFHVGQTVFTTLTTESRTTADAFDNLRFVGEVTDVDVEFARTNIVVRVTDTASVAYLDALDAADGADNDQITAADRDLWTWWSRDAGTEGVLISNEDGTIVNQQIEVFEDRVRPTFEDYDATNSPSRKLSHVSFDEVFNSTQNIRFHDDQGNAAVFDPTTSMPIRVASTGAVLLNSNIEGGSDPARRQTVRDTIGAGDIDRDNVAITRNGDAIDPLSTTLQTNIRTAIGATHLDDINITGRESFPPQTYSSVDIVRNTNDFTLTFDGDITSVEEARIERVNLLTGIFGLETSEAQADITAGSPIAVPSITQISAVINNDVALTARINDIDATPPRNAGVTIVSAVPTGASFSIRLNGFDAAFPFITSDLNDASIRFTRADEDIPFNVLATATGGGLDQVISNEVNTLSIDTNVIAPRSALPTFQSTGDQATITNTGNTTTGPEFSVTANSIGQTQLQKDGTAVPGATMTVSSDGNSIDYVVANRERQARLREVDSSFDPDVFPQYTETSWNANHTAENTYRTNAYADGGAPPLGIPIIENVEGSQRFSQAFIDHLNTLRRVDPDNNNSDLGPLLFTNGNVYGIRPIFNGVPTSGSPIQFQQRFSVGGQNGFRLSTNWGFEFTAYRDATTTTLSSISIPNVRMPSDSTTQIPFNEFVDRINAILQTSAAGPLQGRYQARAIYTTNNTFGYIVIDATFNGPPHDNGEGTFFGFTQPPGDTSNLTPPRAVDLLHVTQPGVPDTAGDYHDVNFLIASSHSDNFLGDGTNTDFTLSHDVGSNLIITVDGAPNIFFSRSGRTISFSTPPAVDAVILATYNTQVDALAGQYLLFNAEPSSGLNRELVFNQLALNGNIRAGANLINTNFRYEVIDFGTFDDATRAMSNINRIDQDDTGIRRLPASVNLNDQTSFTEAESDRYVLVNGTFGGDDAVFVHLLDHISDATGNYLDVDMDHVIQLNAVNDIIPNGLDFSDELNTSRVLYRLNRSGVGDVTQTGTSTQTITRTTDFTNLQIDGNPQRAFDYNLNTTTNRIESFNLGSTNPAVEYDTYTRSEIDNLNEQDRARIHAEGTTHNIASPLSLDSTDNGGYTLRPVADATREWDLNRGTAIAGTNPQDFREISNLDNTILDEVLEGGATQPFVKVTVPNYNQISPQVTDTFSGNGATTVFQLDTTIVRIMSIVSVTINNLTQAADTYTLNQDNGQVTFTTAPSSGTNNIVITYLTDRSLNDGIERVGTFGTLAAITGTTTIVGSETIDTSTITVTGADGSYVRSNEIIGLNTGTSFNINTSIELDVIEHNTRTFTATGDGSTNTYDLGADILGIETVTVRGALVPRTQWSLSGSTLTLTNTPNLANIISVDITESVVVRRLSTAEVGNFITVEGNGSLSAITRTFMTVNPGSLTATTFGFQGVEFDALADESGSPIQAAALITSGNSYIVELIINNVTYHGSFTASSSLPLRRTSIVTFFTSAITWTPSVPPAPNAWRGDDRSQRAYIYQVAGNNTDYYYHLSERNASDNTEADWIAGRYTVDLSTAYTNNNRPILSVDLPITREVYPQTNTFELGYFSNRVTLAGLERYQPLRNANTGAFLASFDNETSSADPTFFWRGFYRTDLGLPVFMLRQVDARTDAISTTWAGWDGNIGNPPGDGRVRQSDAFSTVDARAGEFLYLTAVYREGAQTFQPGLYQRNQADTAWTLIEFNTNMPTTTTANP